MGRKKPKEEEVPTPPTTAKNRLDELEDSQDRLLFLRVVKGQELQEEYEKEVEKQRMNMDTRQQDEPTSGFFELEAVQELKKTHPHTYNEILKEYQERIDSDR